MIVTKLQITNLRAIKTAEFRFQPGFNLIVGVNGVGKTSVLDALSACLSPVTKQVNNQSNRAKVFKFEDIRVGAGAITVECNVRIGEQDFNYLIHKPHEINVTQGENADSRREKDLKKTKKSKFVGEAPSPATGMEPGGRPLAVFFSTSRAVPTQRTSRDKMAEGGITPAFVDAFASRELRLGEFVDWVNVHATLRKERPASQQVLDACEDAIKRFLPGYSNLHLGGDDGKQLWIDHGETAIPVRQLSDGERGVLALILDLTRRLTQANPDMKDPAAEAEAIVLIDEIDLHLHPKWQRDIVRNLCAAFPRCQFVATTHSPQIIGEVEPGRIQIISDGWVYPPTHSFGVDSNRVLEEIMDADPRTSEVKELLSEISTVIGQQRFDRSRELLARLVEKVGDDDPEVTRLRILLDFMEGEA